MLGKPLVPGRPTILDYSRARAYCTYSRCGWGLFGHFFSRLSFLFSFSLSLGLVLGKLPVPGRPTILMTVGQGPTALAKGAGGGEVVWTFSLSSILSLLFLPLFGRRPDID